MNTRVWTECVCGFFFKRKTKTKTRNVPPSHLPLFLFCSFLFFSVLSLQTNEQNYDAVNSRRQTVFNRPVYDLAGGSANYEDADAARSSNVPIYDHADPGASYEVPAEVGGQSIYELADQDRAYEAPSSSQANLYDRKRGVAAQAVYDLAGPSDRRKTVTRPPQNDYDVPDAIDRRRTVTRPPQNDYDLADPERKFDSMVAEYEAIDPVPANKNRTLRKTNYSREPYQHGMLSREESVELLVASGHGPGAFLVRDKNADEDMYVLSLLNKDNRPVHHILKRDANGIFSLDGSACGSAATVGSAIEYLRNRLTQPLTKAILPGAPKSGPRSTSSMPRTMKISGLEDTGDA